MVMSQTTSIPSGLGNHGNRPGRRRQRWSPGRRTRSLRLECLEPRMLLSGTEPLEVMPTSPFIVSPFIDPLVIPAALAPGWRAPDGNLAPNDPAAWSVRETQYAGATPTGDPERPFISPPGPGVNQQDAIGFVAAVPGLFEQHDGQHQVWPNDAGQNSDRLVGEEGGPYPDPVLYHIRLQVAEHSFTSSLVIPIEPDGKPVDPGDLPFGVFLDENGMAELPNSTIYGFNGTFPGPMINAEYGQPVLVRFENDLDLNPLGLDRQDFGDPAYKFLTHLHNAHTAPESDGNPYYMQQNGGGYLPGQWSDNLYLNYPAGGDPNEKQSFLWYHDHVMHQTGSNVYKGMVGLFPIYDPDLDPGDERDAGIHGNALGLPGIKTVNDDGSFDVKYDIPMAFYDVALDDGVSMHDGMHTLPQNVSAHPEWWGKSFYQHFADTGLVGDIFTVNGTAFPVLEVAQRQYRFRFLDASVARIYELAMMTSDAGPVAMPGTQGQWQIPDGELWKPFTQIATMGGLLPEPLSRDSVQIWPAGRNEHIVDFSDVPAGTVIYLTNILEMPDGRKPDWNDPYDHVNEADYKVPMVKIIVGGPPPAGEEGPTSVPSELRPAPVLPPQVVLDTLPHPKFEVDRSGKLGYEKQWQINDKAFDPLVALHTVIRGQPEIWTFINGGGGWVHPMHVHQEEFLVLSRELSTNLHPDDMGKSDTVNLDENESVTFYRNFRTFTGRYVAHCHQLLHEDHAMMFGWTIVDPPSADAPMVTEFAKITDQDTPLPFTTRDFNDRFTDPNVTDSLQSVQIVTTPMHGVLQVNGQEVVAGQHIALGHLPTLVYVPNAGYAGSDSFTWNGSDGAQYSDMPATVYLIVDPADSDIVAQWNLLVLSLGPGHHGGHFMATRRQAMMHSAIYDAVVAFDDKYTPYYVTTPPLPGASVEAAATAAAYQVLYTGITDPTLRLLIQARLDDHLADIPNGQAEAAGIAFGQHVAEAIMMLRATDGAMMAIHMEHPDGTLPGEWRRTASGAPEAPGWGLVTPWVMTNGDQFRGDGPPALTSTQYAADYEETRLWGAVDSTLRTADQTATVMFWQHHPQPKWYKVARDISGVEDLTLAENAQLFHLLSLTMADATIATWDTKYHDSFWRPETAIHLGDTDGNAATAADPTWQSLIASPAFPEYFSGHSMQSAAAAKLLEFYFDTGDYTFQLTAMPGMHMPEMGMPMPRTYNSFWQAAEEAGASRIYGGIHFQFSNQDALLAGSQLAQFVYATAVGDTTPPTVTINQAVGQADPTSVSPINFTVVFSEPVVVGSFTAADLTLGGTAGATTAVVSTTDNITFNVAVSGMTQDGTVVASIPAGVAQDAAGNLNTASTSEDNTITVTAKPPTADIVGRFVGNGDWWVAQSNGVDAFVNVGDGRWTINVTWGDVMVGDFTGNGFDDIVGRVQETGDWWVAVNDGAGNFTHQRWGRWSPSVQWLDVLVGDFNGDGLDDVAGRVASTGDWWVAKSTGSGFVNERWGRWSSGESTWTNVMVGHFNDDGAADIVGRYAATGDWWVALGSETVSGFTNARWGRWSPSALWLDVMVGDFNGDGLDDVAGRVASNGDWWVAESTGSGFVNERWGRWSSGENTWTHVMVGNFNGDSAADIVGRHAATGDWWVALGSETVSGFTNQRWGRWSPSAHWLDVLVGDFNGDGLDDVAGRVASNGDWWVAKSTGSGFVNERWGRWSSGESTWTNVLVGNFAPAPSSLHAAFAPPLNHPATASLSPSDLQPIVDAAVSTLPSELQNISFRIADLPGLLFGQTLWTTILIDRNAAGFGWFVDRTPSVHEEFRAIAPGGDLRAVDRRAVDRIDLLTVVAHELGHLAGLDDLDSRPGSLMSSTLPAGIRRTVWNVAVDKLFELGNVW